MAIQIRKDGKIKSIESQLNDIVNKTILVDLPYKPQLMNVTQGKLVYNGELLDNQSYYVTDYIPILSNQSYIFRYSYPNHGSIYDSNKKYIQNVSNGFDSTISSNLKITMPSNASYIRYNGKIDDLMAGNSNIMMQGSISPSDWTVLPVTTLDALKSNLGITSKWKGKKYVMIGDSITWQDGQAYTQGNVGAIAQGYGTLLKNKTGIATLVNYGISGASMARNSQYPTNGSSCVDGLTKNFSTVDLVTIACGTNDFKLNVPIGTIGVIGDTTFDDTKFYGAYRKLIEYILTQKPNIKIYLLTPIQRDNSGYDVNYTNSAGAKLVDYRNAIIAIGEMYSLPVLDLYAKSGITKLTLATYLMDGLHPNDTGYARMAELINPFVENN